MPIKTRFIILFEGRTGSTMLGGLLNQNPAVGCLGEEVAQIKDQGWERQEAWIRALFFDTERFADERIKPGIEAVGFKVKLRDIADAAALRRLVEREGVRVVQMRRRNFVKQVVSSIRAIGLYRERGLYNLRRDQAEMVPGCSYIPLKRFNDVLLWLLDAEQALERFLCGLDAPVFGLAYEELCDRMQEEVDGLCAFLGVAPADLFPETIKVTPDDLRDAIANFEELAGFYSGTRYAEQFTQVR